MSERPEFTKGPDCVFVFDITAFLHRAFYVTYGERGESIVETDTQFTRHAAGMLANVLREFDVRMMVVAVDSTEPSWRCDSYPAYKAERKAHAPVFRAQVPHFIAALRPIGCVCSADRYEADDIIAALVSGSRDFPVAIVSSDKDLWALLSDDVAIYDPMQREWRVRDDCQKKFGVKPAQLCDYIGLVGDSSDGIPGVPGIGPKTAAKLLAEFGSLDAIYDESRSAALAETVSTKVLGNLRSYRSAAEISRAIARPVPWKAAPQLICDEVDALKAPHHDQVRVMMGAA